MEFIIGKDKFPLIKFDDNTYTHIFPVTKYQFERYIWEAAPDINYVEIIKTNTRISPDKINKRNLDKLFLTNLTFKEATGFAEWSGGRLPSKSELDILENSVSKIDVQEIKRLLERHNNIDKRFLTILNVLEKMNIKNIKDLFTFIQIGEFCCSYTSISAGRIYVKRLNDNSYSEIVGDNPLAIKVGCGFRVLIEREV